MTPQGYKYTELGIIPQEWEICNFDKIVESFTGLTYSPIDIADKGVLVLRSSNIKDGTLCFDDNVFVQMDIPERAIVKTGDILVCVRNGSRNLIGKSAMITEVANNMAFGAFMTIFRVKPNFDNYYIHCLWQTNFIQKQVEANMGATINQITNNDIKRFKCPVPPVEEQRKIAEILGVWDKAIELQARLVDKLELRKRALMQRLLTGRLRLPGFSAPWQKVKLGDLFDERVETRCMQLPLLSITADKGVILQTESDKKDTSNEDKSKYKRISPNDIGYNTMRMWQGRSALSKLEGIVSPAYTIVVPKTNVNPAFMIALIQQPRAIYDFWTHSQGLVDDTLNCKYPHFSQVKVCIPSLAEQTVIAEVLSTADKEIEIAKAKLAAYRTQKRGLMQQLLTGKKRVK